jgi:hypothetical protein
VSQALDDLEKRLKDVDQLLAAHKAITKFKNAETAAKAGGGSLLDISKVFDVLVTDPGRGKPKEVDAINRAAFVLLCAHLQGFIDDLHREAAQAVLLHKVADIEATIKLIKPRNANPHSDIIDMMFAGLGIYDLMREVSWQKCANKTVRERLSTYITERNRIAHGGQAAITKRKVEQFKKYVQTLASRLDESVAAKAQELIGRRPW